MYRILGHLAAGLLLAGAVVGCTPATTTKPASAIPSSREMQGMQERMKEQMEKHRGGPPKDEGKEKPKDEGKDKDKEKP
jgi:hypothetical protein